VAGAVHQSLAYRFVLRCPDPEVEGRAAAMLADFAPRIAGATPDESVGLPQYTIEPWPDRNAAQLALYRDGATLAVHDDPGRIIDHLVRQVSSASLANAPSECLLVHAGVCASPSGGAVLLTGESGSGKTTIVAALVQEGYAYLSDEAAVLEPGSLLVHPWPRPFDFKPGAEAMDRFRDLLGEYGGLTCHVPADRVRKGAVGSRAPVRVIIEYRYQPDSPTRAQSLSRAEAVAVLGSATPALRHQRDAGLQLLARIASGASGYRLRSGSLDEAVRAVRTLAEDLS
jgi:hypothetical protein